MGFLSGKRALIVGVASDRSIAWGIAQAMHREGAELAFTYVNEKFKDRVQPLAESLGSKVTMQLDVTNDAEIDSAFATLARMNGMGPGDTLRAGQKLVINANARPSSGGRSASSGSSRQVSYKVRSGDTLSRIAKVFGVTVSDLVNWNGISKHTTLRPGQKLTVNVRRH